jgi:phosphinothricin acetyltransferase
MKLRYARQEDLDRITEIDNYYIANSNATFFIEARKPEERLSWFTNYKEDGPYRMIVCEVDGVVQGCAFSSRYREHFAFDQTIEVSVYLAHEVRTKGIGTALYQELFSVLRTEPLHLALAGIALPNEPSIALHKKFGFEEVGVFKDYAMKNGTYISSVWMQKKLSV